MSHDLSEISHVLAATLTLTFSELLLSARKGLQEIEKSVFSHFADSCTIVARARADCGLRMLSPGATPERRGPTPGGEA